MRSFIRSALAFAGLCGCSVETASAPPPAAVAVTNGTMTLDWTIGGSKDPDECTQGGAADIDIVLVDGAGADAGEYRQACEAFVTSIALPPDSYSATAVLLDGDGNDRTTPIDVEPFTIHGNDELVIPIDFPPGSFLR